MSDPQASPSDPGPGPATPPPGWYPDPSGTTRWWDGSQWGQTAAPVPATGVGSGSTDRTQAVLAQALGVGGFLFPAFGWIGPLVMYLIAKPGDTYARHHAAESLNFQLTMTIAYVVSFVLMFVLIGFLTGLVVWILSLVFPIIAAVAASRGEWYRYPLTIRMVSGAVG